MRHLLFIRITLLWVGLTFSGWTYAQQGSHSIVGTVVDSTTSEPIPFVTVVAISDFTNRIVEGTTSDETGGFSLFLDSTNIALEFRFMGYRTLKMDEIVFENGKALLGTVQLVNTVQDVDAVHVVGEKSTMEFKLDKRIYHVGKDISSTGMGALEVLNNVPSVNVDIQGQVSLRGNGGVQILINGKPSVVSDDPSKALGSLTADMIESIEIITNPSAKYEAGGTSGIINIILKKDEKKGFNGSVSLNTGYPNNHSLGGSINYRTEKFNFFTQFGGGYRGNPQYSINLNDNLEDSSRVESNGYSTRNEWFYNLTLGADYYLNKYNTITLSGNYAYEFENAPSETEVLVYDTTGQLSSHYLRKETTSALNPKWQYDLQYEKQFRKNKDHKLQFSTLGRFFGKDQESLFDNEFLAGSGSAINQRTETDFYQSDFTFKLDYVNPVSKLFTIEAGSLYEINDVGNDYAVYDKDSTGWALNEGFTNNFMYNQKVLGVYGTGAYENKKWGVKLGLRAENTALHTLLENTNESNDRNYTNFFPTLHTSYKLSKRYQLQAGYSRRIFRPRLWHLNPFFNIQNNFSIRTGNPNLMPEFADSYELTAIMIFDKFSLNSSVYHLYTTDVMESVSYFENNVNISTRMNVGTNRKTGVELNGKWQIAKWVSVMGDFNYGYFDRKGEFESRVFDFQGDQWSTKCTWKFDLKHDWDLEFAPQYQSGYQTIQGEVSGYFHANAGVRKKLWKGKAVINFAVRDILASRIQETIVSQEKFYLYSYSKRGRFLTLGFSYSFGKGEAMAYDGGGHYH